MTGQPPAPPTTVQGPRSVDTAVNENILTRFGESRKKKKRLPSFRERAMRGYRSAQAWAKTPETTAGTVPSAGTDLKFGAR